MLVSSLLKQKTTALIGPKINEALSLLLKFKPNDKLKPLDKYDIKEKVYLCEQMIKQQVIDHFECFENSNTKPDFALSIRKSLINHPEAGKGVFIKEGRIREGQVSAIYPGTVIPPSEISEINDNLLNPTKMTQRPDDFIIQAANEPAKYLNFAHMINHPPKNSSANVMFIYYTFPKEEQDQEHFLLQLAMLRINNPFSVKQTIPKGFSKYISNRFLNDRTPSLLDYLKLQQFSSLKVAEIFAPTVVALATRDIEKGEELYLDYHYDPDIEQPSWYDHVDIEQDKEISRKYKESRTLFGKK